MTAASTSTAYDDAAERLRRLLSDTGWLSSVDADETVDWIVQALADFPEFELFVDRTQLAREVVGTGGDAAPETVAWRLTLACRLDPDNVELGLRLLAAGLELLTPRAAAALAARIERLQPRPADLNRALDFVSRVASVDARVHALGWFASWMPPGAHLTTLRLGQTGGVLLSAEAPEGRRSAAEDVDFGQHLLRARAQIKAKAPAAPRDAIDADQFTQRLSQLRAVLA